MTLLLPRRELPDARPRLRFGLQRPDSTSPPAFLAYVEDVGPLSHSWYAEVPYAFLEHFAGNEPMRRVRLSGLPETDFRRIRDGVSPLGDTPSAGERAIRRAQLREQLSSQAVPVVDLYIGRRHPYGQELRRSLSRSTWTVLRWRDISEGLGPVLVHVLPDDGIDADFAELVSIESPDHQTLAALTDIFSLKHIPDAGYDERSREPAIAETPPGADDGPAATRPLTTFRYDVT